MDEIKAETQRLWNCHFNLEDKAGWTRIGMYTALVIRCFHLSVQFGKERGWVAAGHWATETFYVHSKHNKAVAAIAATDAESGIMLFDSQKRPRADLLVSDGRVKLGIQGDDGHTQVELVTTAAGPMLRFFDAKTHGCR